MRILFSVGLLHACKRSELFYQPKSMRSSLPEQPLSMGILVFGKLERKRIKKKKYFFSRSSSNICRLKKVTSRASVIEMLMSSASKQTLS